LVVLQQEARDGIRHHLRRQVHQRDALCLVQQGEADHRGRMVRIARKPAIRQHFDARGAKKGGPNLLGRRVGGHHRLTANARMRPVLALSQAVAGRQPGGHRCLRRHGEI
jgi:hypothetical protein